MPRIRRAAIAAALAACPVALAYRFARRLPRSGRLPAPASRRRDRRSRRARVEDVEVPTADGLDLPGWWIPAGDAPAPGVVLVHGWESARDRTLPNAQVLHALGLPRAHARRPRPRREPARELLPLSVGEYAADARAGVAWLRARPEVTRGRAPGPLDGRRRLASSPRPTTRASTRVVAVAAPGRPVAPHPPDVPPRPACRSPAPIAWPLAWLTTRVYLRPRGHTVASVSATRAVQTSRRPVLLVHGTDDGVVPVDRPRAARRAPAGPPARATSPRRCWSRAAQHSWLYEYPAYRAAIARFLATPLGGPLTPDEAAAIAEAVPAERLPDPERITTLDDEPGGLRSLTCSSAGPRAGPAACGRASSRPPRRSRPPDDRLGRRPHQAAVREFATARSRRALDRIVRAGTRAHSSKNQQRWAFVVVEDRERLRALSKIGPYAGHLAGAAAAVALVTPDPRGPGQPLSVVWDVGGAAAQMMLVAWELGIGSCPATVYEHDLARELLGYPDGPLVRVHPLVRLPGGPGEAHRAAQGRRPAAARRGRPPRALGRPLTAGLAASRRSARRAVQVEVVASTSSGSSARRLQRRRARGCSGAGAPSATYDSIAASSPTSRPARSESSHLCSSTSQYAWTRSRSGPTQAVIRASVGR